MDELGIKTLEDTAISKIEKADSSEKLESIRIEYLGRKSKLSDALKGLGKLSSDERAKVGKAVNDAKGKIEAKLFTRKKEIEGREKEAKIETGTIDITLPGKGVIRGRPHPITQVFDEVIEIFEKMGYSVEEGPDIENDWYNFEALNFPKEHPARDMHDTFYVDGESLLRTHTSPVQIRTMEEKKPPLAIIAPGRVYRCDADVTHSPVFHQLEGLLVDKGITFSDLKGTLTAFLHQVFGRDRNVRFRPSFFPFTEPSAEVDVECIICGGVGCRVCKNTGWLEILGAGMVDPNVFKSVGIDPEVYSGFAFGMGIERIAMLKFGVNDIRLFYENDTRFLRQF
ncbi:phenylalanine--tRNA ligase subunit alpha [Candidatus Margulisiibacteriota bacterium]